MAYASETTLTYFDRAVLGIVDDVYQRTRAPVRTIAVQTRLGKGDRNCRRYLTALEGRGLVLRVGLRGGWLPVAKIEPTKVAAEFARLRSYVTALEAQLDAAALKRPTPKRCRPRPEQLILPGFDGLVSTAGYLN